MLLNYKPHCQTLSSFFIFIIRRLSWYLKLGRAMQLLLYFVNNLGIANFCNLLILNKFLFACFDLWHLQSLLEYCILSNNCTYWLDFVSFLYYFWLTSKIKLWNKLKNICIWYFQIYWAFHKYLFYCLINIKIFLD